VLFIYSHARTHARTAAHAHAVGTHCTFPILFFRPVPPPPPVVVVDDGDDDDDDGSLV